MAEVFAGQRVGVVVLAGGKLEESLAPLVDVKHKAWLRLGGKMMVERVLDSLEPVGELCCRVLVAPAEDVPEAVRARVDAVATPGRGILDSLESGIEALPRDCDLILAVPCDVPFMEPDSVRGFLRLCEQKPGSVWYSFIRKDVSEARYPGLRHTWVPLADAFYCGGSLVMFRAGAVAKARELMHRITEARKSPWILVRMLGWSFIWRFLRRKLTVAEVEARLSALLGLQGRGVETPYADVGYNVDAPDEWKMAQRLVGDLPAAR